MTSLGEYRECRTCGQYGWTDTHKCPPVYRCTDEDSKVEIEDGKRIFADNPEEAAREFAEQNDAAFCEYPDEQAVFVLDGDTVREFAVFGESVRSYSTKETGSTPLVNQEDTDTELTDGD